LLFAVFHHQPVNLEHFLPQQDVLVKSALNNLKKTRSLLFAFFCRLSYVSLKNGSLFGGMDGFGVANDTPPNMLPFFCAPLDL
jgi:hypothetical protein